MVTLCSLFTAYKLAFYFFVHIYASYVKIVIMFKVRIINFLFITELVFCNNPKAYENPITVKSLIGHIILLSGVLMLSRLSCIERTKTFIIYWKFMVGTKTKTLPLLQDAVGVVICGGLHGGRAVKGRDFQYMWKYI